MSKVSGGRRLLTDDFNVEDRALIQKLAFVLNPFLEQVISAFNSNITISENLDMEIVDISLIVDGSGLTTSTASFQTGLSSISGILVLSASPTDSTDYPINAPFVSFKKNNNIVKIQHVTGLPADTKYSLKILVIGS